MHNKKVPQTVTLQVTIPCQQISKKKQHAPEHSFALTLRRSFVTIFWQKNLTEDCNSQCYRLQCFSFAQLKFWGRLSAERIFRGFLFLSRRFFFADFLAGFFLLIFVGKSAQKNPPGKSPGKSSKIYTTKILQHISADCPGQQIWLYGLALVNQIFDSDFCLAGVPLQVTFANYESTFSKPRMDKNKTTNPFGQTTKRCLTAARATFQNYESESQTR